MVLNEKLEDTSVHIIEDYEEKELIEKLYEKIFLLPEKEQYVICNYYGLFGNTPHSQREIAEQVGMSQAYVSQIFRKALEKIKEEIYMEYDMNVKEYKKTP